MEVSNVMRLLKGLWIVLWQEHRALEISENDMMYFQQNRTILQICDEAEIVTQDHRWEIILVLTRTGVTKQVVNLNIFQSRSQSIFSCYACQHIKETRSCRKPQLWSEQLKEIQNSLKKSDGGVGIGGYQELSSGCPQWRYLQDEWSPVGPEVAELWVTS